MEYLVDFELDVPAGTPDAEVRDRVAAEASAAARLAEEGRLIRLWRRNGGAHAFGLYSAGSRGELDALLDDLPLRDWLRITVETVEPHPNDPAAASLLPAPRLVLVFRLEATLGEPLDLGEVDGRRRRVVPLTGGTFAGPQLNGRLLPGAGADRQTVLSDGTTVGDIRYTLQTDAGARLAE